MAVAKVLAPTHQQTIDISNDHGSGLEAQARSSEFAKLRANSGHCLSTWSHVQVAIRVRQNAAPISHRETKKVQTFPTDLTKANHLGLLAVDREPKAALQCRFDPLLKTFTLVKGKHRKIVRVADDFRLGPVRWTITAVEQHLEPMEIEIRQ